MKEPCVSMPVREQFRTLTENIRTLTEVRCEVGPGQVGARVEKEVAAQIEALGELRERFFQSSIAGGGLTPLESTPEKVEVLDLSDAADGFFVVPMYQHSVPSFLS